MAMSSPTSLALPNRRIASLGASSSVIPEDTSSAVERSRCSRSSRRISATSSSGIIWRYRQTRSRYFSMGSDWFGNGGMPYSMASGGFDIAGPSNDCVDGVGELFPGRLVAVEFSAPRFGQVVDLSGGAAHLDLPFAFDEAFVLQCAQCGVQ